MNISEEVFKRLDALAAKLGVTAQHLWEVLIRQAKVEAYSCLGWAALWFVLLIVGVGCVISAVRQPSKEDSTTSFGVGLVVSIPSALCLCFMVNDAITPLFNPEFYALKQILEVLK